MMGNDGGNEWNYKKGLKIASVRRRLVGTLQSKIYDKAIKLR
ncbi:MAG: hypothetical protein HLUCCA11_18050 [Phormidesmis priestleyi Ana]|uniref:Uncharacterized protein n=1 Tax=Phormidesmis priestleyi Ana TaxID=1666911 RepID=A0A0P8BIX0_9CYAN|nr:MAG: hypothetical protein HLUCCA11_18050 [Phormidesmis priestleyi Ana]